MESEQLAGQRKPRNNTAVAVSVAKRLSEIVPRAPVANIQPLNPGFFTLEAMRAHAGAKVKAEVRTKHKG